ncbi:MAG: tail fiber domain-containing protein, partial [Bacteriovoracaceae bacterium]
ANIDKLFGSLIDGVVDASDLHTHDDRYVQLSSTSAQDFGTGGFVTTGASSVGSSTIFTNTMMSVKTSADTDIGLAIRAKNATQSADLFQVQDNSGASLASISSNGSLSLANGASVAASSSVLKSTSGNQLIVKYDDSNKLTVDVSNTGTSTFTADGTTPRFSFASGNVGIGLTAPTAVLHLKAGTATANTAPIKFSSGVLLTSPEDGAVEFDGTSFYVTSGVTRKKVALASTEAEYLLTHIGDVDLTTTPPVIGDYLKYDGTNWIPGTVVTAESDPNVTAFAKAPLPTCASGEVLKGDGTNLSCVTDSTGAFSGSSNVAVITSAGGTLTTSAVTATELGYVSGVTSAIQTQLNAKASLSGATFTGAVSSSSSFTGTAFYYTSDARLKKDVKTIDSALSKVSQLRGVHFNWKKDNKPEIGFIAQEVEKVLPDLIQTVKPGTTEEIKSVKYGNMVAVVLEAIKEFHQKYLKSQSENVSKIAKLESENKELKKKYDDLKKDIDSLKESMKTKSH